jgi:hypothetical protein
MNLFQQAQAAVQIPSVQFPTTGASLLTLVLGFLDQIHGPAATIGVVLGAFWVGLQIYLAAEKRWFRKEK